jgi:hypothetical protein
MLKSIIIGLSMILVLSFAACGNKNADTNGNTNGSNDTVMEDIGQGMEDVKDDMKNAAEDMMGKDNTKNN